MPQAPFMGFTPELLAQIAQGAFRPPGQAMGGGLPGGGMGSGLPSGGDGGLGAGVAGLGMGLGMLGKMGPTTDGRTTPEGTVSPFPVGGGPKGPSGGAMPESPILAASTGNDWGLLGRIFGGLF